MTDVFIYDHLRTPRGKGRPDGALHEITPVQLATQVLAALRIRNGFDPSRIDEVGLGIVMPVGEQGADLTRVALLQAGYGDSVAGYQLNRFCTSALDTLRMGFGLIASGQAGAAIGGGVESMSRVPIGSDGGAVYSDPAVCRDYLYMPNGVAADLMASLYGFTRDQVDAYAVRSQQRAAAAQAEDRFSASLVPVCDINGEVVLAHDEAVRGGTTMADLAKMKPFFDRMGESGFDAIALRRYPWLERIEHIHTAATSSGIVDGAAAVLLGNAEFGSRHALRPRARMVACATGASEPLLSLGGPMPVTERVLAQAGMKASDIDLFEVNEAFAVVPMRFQQHFEIDPERLNVNGGAIALGHPLGATGAMLVGTALDELERRGSRTALITLCAAAGQATALIIERI
ncbi:acetyl-CoA C-acetyltransferase [Massilia cavernae]|uniref:Acetyl-CoA C-acetyltransferase n=1 Tax=Massilia cavernae TaxID=2320864 RepID=A0A418Y0N5_9BURK|nr:acetyl-CoA C-acetyltransferase [Massilia cavernae]RJG18840.1 acetyl-CoA C-acetyltransferase [Massilia cavernae]